MQLRNLYDKATLKKKLAEENFSRITLSFYRYVILDNVESFRDELYLKFDELKVLGRIFIAREGINAQLSVPDFNFEKFRMLVDSITQFKNVDFKIAVDTPLSPKGGEKTPTPQATLSPLGAGGAFHKLIVRVRPKIVADGLADDTFDVTNVGNHLTARQWNEAMEAPSTVVVDMRNHYESEIGHFEGAVLPDADTFKQELPMVLDALKDKRQNKILLYCTGGIRCEKASAFLKHHGFEDVNQLHGGIIHYAQQVKQEGLKSKFIGKNFVFDERMGERITEEVISVCHQCGNPSDRHVNCANDDCHLLFIQCEDCAEQMNGCCTAQCVEIAALPVEEQLKLRKGLQKEQPHAVFKSRLRPKLNMGSF